MTGLIRSSLAGVALLAVLAAAPAAEAQQQSKFVYSPVGPGAGHGTISMGGRVFLFVPTFDLNYVRGITDNFDFVLNLSTLGVLNLADIGVRMRLVGTPDSGFSLGLKAAPTIVASFFAAAGEASGGFVFGLTPGVVLGFGSRATQFSLAAEFPMVLAGAGFVTGGGGGGSASGTDFVPFLRPAATIEFPVGETTNMYVQAQAYVALKSVDTGFIGPIIALGAAW